MDKKNLSKIMCWMGLTVLVSVQSFLCSENIRGQEDGESDSYSFTVDKNNKSNGGNVELPGLFIAIKNTAKETPAPPTGSFQYTHKIEIPANAWTSATIPDPTVGDLKDEFFKDVFGIEGFGSLDDDEQKLALANVFLGVGTEGSTETVFKYEFQKCFLNATTEEPNLETITTLESVYGANKQDTITDEDALYEKIGRYEQSKSDTEKYKSFYVGDVTYEVHQESSGDYFLIVTWTLIFYGTPTASLPEGCVEGYAVDIKSKDEAYDESDEYTITYRLGEYNGEPVSEGNILGTLPESGDVGEGEEVTPLVLEHRDNVVDFTGWQEVEVPDGETAVTVTNGKFTMPERNVTLQATWSTHGVGY